MMHDDTMMPKKKMPMEMEGMDKRHIMSEKVEDMPMSQHEAYMMTPPTEEMPRIIPQVNKERGVESVRGPNSPASFRNEYDEKNDPETNLRGQFVSDAVEKTEGRI